MWTANAAVDYQESKGLVGQRQIMYIADEKPKSADCFALKKGFMSELAKVK